MIANTLSYGQNNKKLCQFIQCIQQNDLKALKKMVKSKLGNNLKLVQSGILIAFQNGNTKNTGHFLGDKRGAGHFLGDKRGAGHFRGD